MVQVSCQYHHWLLCYFYKGLTRNLEIRNTPVWVLPNIWRLGGVRDTKFGTNVSNEMLLKAAKCQGYSFYRFWVIKGKPTRGSKLPHSPIQIRVKKEWQICSSINTYHLLYIEKYKKVKLPRGMKNLNYLLDHILYQVFKIILSI